jgi:hypothetical protein
MLKQNNKQVCHQNATSSPCHVLSLAVNQTAIPRQAKLRSGVIERIKKGKIDRLFAL